MRFLPRALQAQDAGGLTHAPDRFPVFSGTAGHSRWPGAPGRVTLDGLFERLSSPCVPASPSPVSVINGPVIGLGTRSNPVTTPSLAAYAVRSGSRVLRIRMEPQLFWGHNSTPDRLGGRAPTLPLRQKGTETACGQVSVAVHQGAFQVIPSVKKYYSLDFLATKRKEHSEDTGHRIGSRLGPTHRLQFAETRSHEERPSFGTRRHTCRWWESAGGRAGVKPDALTPTRRTFPLCSCLPLCLRTATRSCTERSLTLKDGLGTVK